MMVNDLNSMVQESLSEMILVAEACIDQRKSNGGCYGYPGALLLFSILDTIGSYYLGKDYKVFVENKEKRIAKTNQFFYILNSPDYYGQNLSEIEIKTLYDLFRSTLIHNSAMPPKCTLEIGTIDDPLFSISGNEYPVLCLSKFLVLSKKSVENFLHNAINIIPGSTQERNILLKEFK